MLNSLTGDNCLMMALAETPATTADDFTPGDVYQIARLLGVDVELLPCIVFFTDPKQRRDTLVLSLANFFSAADDATDDRLTKWFRSVQSVIDACVGRGTDNKLECLRDGINQHFPRDAEWLASLKQAGSIAVPAEVERDRASAARRGTVARADLVASASGTRLLRGVEVIHSRRTSGRGMDWGVVA